MTAFNKRIQEQADSLVADNIPNATEWHYVLIETAMKIGASIMLEHIQEEEERGFLKTL